MTQYFKTPEEAADRRAEGQVVCAVPVDNEARYFLASVDATDDEMSDLAFRVEHGRDKSTYERWLINMAKKEFAHA